MSSLITLIRKSGLHGFPEMRPKIRQALPSLRKTILSHDTPKVRMDSIIDEQERDDCEDAITDIMRALEDATPPFQFMWFEGCRYGVRGAVLTERIEDTSAVEAFQLFAGVDSEAKPKQEVFLRVFGQDTDTGMCLGPVSYLQLGVDEYGQPINGRWLSAAEAAINHEAELNFSMPYILAALESIVRMNTEGTRISPPWREMKNTREKPRPIAPACVWHTIHIGGPENVPQSSGTAVSREAQERREHWVRAHRRDYRKGPGLFGRIKKLVWVPEHKAGDPKLGCVIPEFVIDRRK